MAIGAPVETVGCSRRHRGRAGRPSRHLDDRPSRAPSTPDPPLPRAAVTVACHAIAARARAAGAAGSARSTTCCRAGRRVGRERTRRTGLLRAGRVRRGRCPVDLPLADASPHALIGGPSGSGKTNLLLTMIASLATRYTPDELELYLLDFKEGVSFAQFAPGAADPTLAAARAADRRQHQHRPRVRAGAAAVPRRRDAPPRPRPRRRTRSPSSRSCARTTRTGSGRGSSR